MYIFPILGHNTSHKSALKIPSSAKLNHINKKEYLENIRYSEMFDKFNKNLTRTMQTFVYTVKAIYKG